MNKIATRLKEIQERGGMRRTATVSTINEEERTVELSFSSETETVERWFGIEVLGHNPDEIDLSRINNNAPVLWMHNKDDQRGVIVTGSGRVDQDRIGRCKARYSNSPAGEQLFRDIVDGIVTKVSVGYIVNGMKLVEERDGVDVYRITSWIPYEVSNVSVAADDNIGVGRSAEIPPQEKTIPIADNSEKSVVPVTVKDNRNMTPEEIAANEAAARTAGRTEEQNRVRTITEMGERFGYAEAARNFVKDGKSTDEFREHLLTEQHKREQKPINEQSKAADIGLTGDEARQFSFLKVVRALSEPTDRRAQEDAAFEFEASRAAREKSGKNTDRFIIPSDVLTRALNSNSSGVTNADTGGYSIANTLLSQSFIEILRNRAILLQRATTMGGLVGNIDIPRQVAAASAYWLGEDDDATESEMGLGQISMTPKTLAGYSEITRKLLKQSSLDIEGMIRADLARVMALAIDKAGFYGTGSDHQPLGLNNQTGINAVSLTTANKPTWAEIVNMETQIALDNADVDSMTYIANANFRGYAKTTLKFPDAAGNQTIWEGAQKAKDGMVNGYSCDITNQVVTGDHFFGNWADMIIGMWGGLEMMVDPFSGSKKGRIRIVTFQDVDIALRRVESFTIAR